MKKFLIRFLVLFGIVAAVAGVATGLALYSFSSLPNAQPVPSHNGYDEFVRIGTAISTSFRTYKMMNETELRHALKTNETLIAQGHEALKLECRVPLPWPPDSNSVDEAAAPINLSEAFAAEGMLAEMENRTQDALKCYLDIVRLGSQSCQGGLLADGLRGIAIEARGAECLQKLSVILDSKSCAQAAQVLETADSETGSLSDYVKQEKILYHQKLPGTKDTLNWYYSRLLTVNTEIKSHAEAARTFADRQSKIRATMVGIAVRAYEADKGVRPKGIEDLVPAYLKAVPVDSAKGTNMTLAL